MYTVIINVLKTDRAVGIVLYNRVSETKRIRPGFQNPVRVQSKN